MILIDFNHVMLANIMVTLKLHQGMELDESVVRHMSLNSIHSFIKKFGGTYGDLVFCVDDRNNWRKEVFPFYKSHRKADRDDSGLDWSKIFECINTIKAELVAVFPYKVLQVHGAEADDIIATLCHRYGHLGLMNAGAEQILILSSDKDFMQLQKYANVEQYSTVQEKWVRCSNPARYLHEHILKGDRGDGVPNFRSADNIFSTPERQKPVSTKNIDLWNGMEPEDFCTEETLKNYYRNKQLVDLDCIPADISEQILSAYDTCKHNDKSGLFDYFITHKLRILMEDIGDF